MGTNPGTIHVTTAAAKCGVAVQVPGAGVTAGPIKINLPPIEVNVPVAIPGVLPPSGGSGSGTPSQQAIDLTSDSAPAAKMPVLLLILAVLALSLVTATYVRLYLLRREPPAA